MRRLIGPLIVLLAIAAAYGRTLDYPFVFDDQKLVVENTAIRDLGNLPAILGAAVAPQKSYLEQPGWVDPGYRPVRMVSYAIDHALWGLRPRGFRLTNLALHLLNALLVGALAARLVGRPARWPAALLFALHPLATECVTYISGRRDVLFAGGYLGALVLFLDHRAQEPTRSGGRWRAPAIVALFLLALGAKEMAVTLPIACALLDLAIGGPRGLRRRAPLHGTLFAIAAAYAAAVVLWKNPADAAPAPLARLGGSAALSALTMARVLGHYLSLVVWPGALSADYSFDAFPASCGPLDPPATALALLALAAIALGAVRLWRAGARVEAALAAFFFAALLPVLQIVPHPEPIADRHLYLPLACAVLLFLRALVVWIRAGGVRPALALLLVAIVALGARTFARNGDWASDDALFRSVVARYPRCARANLAVGLARLEGGRDREALDWLDRAIEILPEEPWTTRKGAMRTTALFYRGRARSATGLLDLALRDLDAVLAEIGDRSGFDYVRLERAEALRRKGDLGPAVAAFEAALRDATPLADTELSWYRLGEAHLARKDFAAAADAFRRLAEARLPGEKQARYRLAEALEKTGRVPEARAALDRALGLDPGFEAARYLQGELALREGRFDEADAAFRELARAHPEEERLKLKVIEVYARRKEAAEAQHRPPTAVAPEAPAARARRRARGLVAMSEQAWRQNQPEGALRALEAAAEADPTWDEPCERLAALLSELARPEEAAKARERARARRGGK